MSRYFSFRFRKDTQEAKQSLVLFCHSDIEVSSLIKEIKEDVMLNLVPSDVVVLGYGITDSVANGIISNSMFSSEFESFVGAIEDRLEFITVDGNGDITTVVKAETVLFKNEMMLAGANEIFKRRKGLITSSPSYHFAKPSGDHCDKFIRASNLFTSGVEVAFLAISLLPYLTDNIKRIYVDTSSISFLVSITVQLSKKFQHQQPIIESFESYSVFKEPYGFVTSPDSLVIISATTSGSLAKNLIHDTAFSADNILTLFFSNIPDEQHGLFDISSVVEPGITSVPEEHCKFCQYGSKVIRIEGEQFLPETPKHELLVIKKSDFDSDRQSFFKEFAVKGILKFDTSPSDDWEKEHFYIDITKLLESHPVKFKSTLKKKLNKHFSRDIQTVISLDDEGSWALTQTIRAEIDDDNINWVKFADISEEELKDSQSVFVVAGAITSGRKLLATARKLRGIANSATITYFVGFSKLPNKTSFEQLEKDLCLGGFELVVLRNCNLPRFSEKSKSVWDIEKEKLSAFSEIEDPLSGTSERLSNLLASRAKTLEAVSIDDLFLTSPKGNSLNLRETFAFWGGLGLSAQDSSQADVYWTIQAILHDLRIKSDSGLATTYHSTLISPVCFDRFNDGVIQACLLRAAKTIELNYAVDEIYSRQMTDIIISVIRNWDNPQGEASLEFLFALWAGQLKLLDSHLKEIIALETDTMPDDVVFILRKLSQVIGG
ncbi:hypothetical protein [Shewanella algae]|uniref:hypothetical protein n=1 Tax=Shewanella algae TaxID=38313 RepID=UPI0031F51BD0